MWEYIVLAVFLAVAVIVFVRIGSFKYRGRPVVGLFPRILISLFFPVIGLVVILLGSFLIILVVTLLVLFLLMLVLFFLFARPKFFYFRKKL